MQGKKHYQEKLFTTFRLSDRIPENNFYRLLDRCLNLNFLYASTKKYYGKEGQASIDPVVFFKLLLTGYFENLQSDRRIIENARLRLDILYFIGYDIDEELPWHSTLSRTRQLMGEEVFQTLFKSVLKFCIEKGMVAGKRQAIDSVFVKANASMESLVDKEILEDGVAYINSLNEDEQKEDEFTLKVPSKTPVKRSNKTRYSPTDPDARIATKPGKPTQMNYLGQVSVDTAHHVITNIEAHHADKRDSECLEEVLDHTKDNLSSFDIKVEEIVADTNYSSSDALKAINKQDVIGYVPNFGGYKNEREGFVYCKEGDYYQCQQGAKLLFKGIRTSPDRGAMKQYRASAKDCRNCLLKTQCLKKSSYKTLADSVDKGLYDEMHKRMISWYAYQMIRLRSSTVEPVIGTLVNVLAMKRVNSRGIDQANKHMIGAAIAYNLKKWIKWQVKSPSIASVALQIQEKSQMAVTYCLHFKHLLERNRSKWIKIVLSQYLYYVNLIIYNVDIKLGNIIRFC
jgi:transposase